MPFTLAKIAGGPGSSTYRRVGDLNLTAQVSTKTVPVRDKTSTTYINKVTLNVRMQVKGVPCGTNCPSEYPALYDLRISAPNGADMVDCYAAYIKVLEGLIDSSTKSPKAFLFDQQEILVP